MSLAQRIERGRRAIAMAKGQGRDTAAWERQLAELERLACAEEIDRRLGERGYCPAEAVAPKRDKELGAGGNDLSAAASLVGNPKQGLTSVTQPIEVVDADTLAQAREVAERTRELLSTKGWCLWKCSTLGGEVIAIVRDESVTDVPRGYPTYTEAELAELFKDDISEATLRLVHEAKKLAGARVVSEEKVEKAQSNFLATTF